MVRMTLCQVRSRRTGSCLWSPAPTTPESPRCARRSQQVARLARTRRRRLSGDVGDAHAAGGLAVDHGGAWRWRCSRIHDWKSEGGDEMRVEFEQAITAGDA